MCVCEEGGRAGRKEGRAEGGGQLCSQIGGALHRGSQSDHRRIASRGGDRRQPACMPPRRMHPEPETLEDPAHLPQFYSPPLPHSFLGTQLYSSPPGEVYKYVHLSAWRAVQICTSLRLESCTNMYISPPGKGTQLAQNTFPSAKCTICTFQIVPIGTICTFQIVPKWGFTFSNVLSALMFFQKPIRNVFRRRVFFFLIG